MTQNLLSTMCRPFGFDSLFYLHFHLQISYFFIIFKYRCYFQPFSVSRILNLFFPFRFLNFVWFENLERRMSKVRHYYRTFWDKLSGPWNLTLSSFLGENSNTNQRGSRRGKLLPQHQLSSEPNPKKKQSCLICGSGRVHVPPCHQWS